MDFDAIQELSEENLNKIYFDFLENSENNELISKYYCSFRCSCADGTTRYAIGYASSACGVCSESACTPGNTWYGTGGCPNGVNRSISFSYMDWCR